MESFTAQFRVLNYFPCEKGFSTPPRVFDYPYLLYVHGGRGAYKVNGRRYECERGDLFYCPPFEENVIFADEYEPFILSGLEFTVSDVHFLNENMPGRANLNDDPFAASCILKMIDEYLYDKTGAGEICSHLFKRAFAGTVPRADAKRGAPKTPRPRNHAVSFAERGEKGDLRGSFRKLPLSQKHHQSACERGGGRDAERIRDPAKDQRGAEISVLYRHERGRDLAGARVFLPLFFQPAIQAENGFHARAVPKPQQNAVKKFHGVLQ